MGPSLIFKSVFCFIYCMTFLCADPESPHPVTLVYRGATDNITTEAVITYKQHWVYGRVSLGATRRHFIIETIPGDGLVAWAEINQGVWNDERRPLAPPPKSFAESERIIPVETMRELLAQVRENTLLPLKY
jgi:hypothetical protein